MKSLIYLPGTGCTQITNTEIEAFKAASGITELSATFILYCKTQNGGVPAAVNEYFIPDNSCVDYWNFCKDRVINPAGEIDVSKILGINDNVRFSITHWTQNARNIWGLADNFYCVAYDGIGSKIVSRLLEGDDKVYFWEPHVHPHYFLIADTLATFYDGLKSVPEHE